MSAAAGTCTVEWPHVFAASHPPPCSHDCDLCLSPSSCDFVAWILPSNFNLILVQEARQRANLERAAQLEALLHAAFCDAAHPPDLEFGCFAALLGPSNSGFEGEALLRIDTGDWYGYWHCDSRNGHASPRCWGLAIRLRGQGAAAHRHRCFWPTLMLLLVPSVTAKLWRELAEVLDPELWPRWRCSCCVFCIFALALWRLADTTPSQTDQSFANAGDARGGSRRHLPMFVQLSTHQATMCAPSFLLSNLVAQSQLLCSMLQSAVSMLHSIGVASPPAMFLGSC